MTNQEQNNQIYSPDAEVSKLVPMSGRELIQVMVVGAGVGLVSTVVTFLLYNFVFTNLLCNDASESCSQAPVYSVLIATILAAIGGLGALVRMRVYRPLLAVLAVAIGLWALNILVLNWVWYAAIPVAMILFAIAYGLFAWICRIRSLILALVVIIVLVVVTRLVLN